MLYFLPALLSVGVDLALLVLAGRWIGGRKIASQPYAFRGLVAFGALVFMPILGGMIGHPPVPYVMPLVLALYVLADGSGGLMWKPLALAIGYAVAFLVLGAAAHARATRTH